MATSTTLGFYWAWTQVSLGLGWLWAWWRKQGSTMKEDGEGLEVLGVVCVKTWQAKSSLKSKYYITQLEFIEIFWAVLFIEPLSNFAVVQHFILTFFSVLLKYFRIFFVSHFDSMVINACCFLSYTTTLFFSSKKP